MIGDPSEAGRVLAKHFTKAVSNKAVAWAAEVVGTPEEQPWVLNLCDHLEDLPSHLFELGTEVTVETTGEVVRSILTLARWRALVTEAKAMARSAERVRQLVDDLRGAEDDTPQSPL